LEVDLLREARAALQLATKPANDQLQGDRHEDGDPHGDEEAETVFLEPGQLVRKDLGQHAFI
jgi:hypothetical protein